MFPANVGEKEDIFLFKQSSQGIIFPFLIMA
jgi:hypothetical protein